MATFGPQACAENGGENTNGSSWVTNYASQQYAGRYNGDRHAAFRFTSVGVPQGATITSATLIVDYDCDFNPIDWRIYGEDVDDSAAFSGGATRRPTQWTQTTGYNAVTGNPSSSLPATAAVQEIVNRPGWASGADMALAIMNQGTVNTRFMCIEQIYRPGSDLQATLTIVYTASSGYSLECEATSFAWTGSAASLEYGYAIDAATASFTWSAPVETVLTYQSTNNYTIVADSTSYVWTGTDADLIYAEGLGAGSGSYSWAGTDVDWTVVRYGAPGAFTWTGSEVSLEYGNILGAEGTSYAITGSSATLLLAGGLTAGGGSYEIVPGWSTMDDTYRIPEETLNLDETYSALAGTWNSGSSPGQVRGLALYLSSWSTTAPSGTFRFAVYAITGTPGTDAVPTGSALMVTESVDIADLSRFNTMWLELRPTTAWTPLANTDYAVVVDGSGLTLTGASLRWGVRSTDISGRNVALYDGSWATTEVGLTGPLFAVVTTPSGSLEYGPAVDANSDTFAWTGTDATLTYGSPTAYIINAEGDSYTWLGRPASLKYNPAFDLDSGSYVWTGTDTTLTANLGNLAALGTSYAWTGMDANLTLAGSDGWTRQITGEEVWTAQ